MIASRGSRRASTRGTAGTGIRAPVDDEVSIGRVVSGRDARIHANLFREVASKVDCRSERCGFLARSHSREQHADGAEQTDAQHRNGNEHLHERKARGGLP